MFARRARGAADGKMEGRIGLTRLGISVDDSIQVFGRCLTYSRPLTNELLGSEGNDLR